MNKCEMPKDTEHVNGTCEHEDILSKEMLFTGTQVNYYVVCKTKLWLFSHFVTMEHTSDIVSYGKLIHEISYEGRREIIIDDRIAIDFIRKGDKMVIHEVKKDKKIEDAHKYQLLYYLYYLNQKGVENIEGEIDYPLLRRREKVVLTEELKEEIAKILAGIKEVVEMPKPPAPSRSKICRKCAYFELCWV